MLAQQSTEKALKSAIIWLGIPVPKTHDLVFHQRRLPGEWRIRLFSDEELNTLSNWAVESRYPGENPEPVREDAEFSIATAQHVLEAITADLATVGYHPNN